MGLIPPVCKPFTPCGPSLLSDAIRLGAAKIRAEALTAAMIRANSPVPSPSPEAPAPMAAVVPKDDFRIVIRNLEGHRPEVMVGEAPHKNLRPLGEIIRDAALVAQYRSENLEVEKLKAEAHTARSVQLAASQEIERLNGKVAKLEAANNDFGLAHTLDADRIDTLKAEVEELKAKLADREAANSLLAEHNTKYRRQLMTPPTPAPPATPCLTAEEATALETLNRALDQAEALGLDATAPAYCRNEPATYGIEQARHALIAKFRDRVLARPVKPHRTK